MSVPRLFCRLCGYPRFSLRALPGSPAQPSRLFGLIAGRAATADRLEARCLQCDARNVVEAPAPFFIGTPYNTPLSEYGSNTPRGASR
jgi:hypothetical protein